MPSSFLVPLEPVLFQTMPQGHPRAVEHDPKVVRRHAKFLTNVPGPHTVQFAQQERLRDPFGQVRHAAVELAPEFRRLETLLGSRPSFRAESRAPIRTLVENALTFVCQKFQVREGLLATLPPKMVHDLVA